MNDLFPTLFSKTLFIVSAQLFITWLTTHFVFLFFKRIDWKIEKENPYADGTSGDAIGGPLQGNADKGSRPILSYTDEDADGETETRPEVDVLDRLAEETDPRYQWVFSSWLLYSILIFSSGLFLLLLFWGIDQNLGVSFSLFSAWSFLTGIQLEYVLLNVEEGLGRKVLALASLIVLSAAIVRLYSHVDLGFLQIPLFLALTALLIFSVFNLFYSMDGMTQRIWSGLGVAIFTLYLVFDFNSLLKKESVGDDTWPDAMYLAIKIYLDIINLILHLLRLLGRHH
jgi:FtsH-binding integral membrane protein